MGIENDSIVTSREQLRGQVQRVMHKYRQPALVESYVEGRELTCGVIGNNGDLRVLPILEVDFTDTPPNWFPFTPPFIKTISTTSFAINVRRRCRHPSRKRFSA